MRRSIHIFIIMCLALNVACMPVCAMAEERMMPVKPPEAAAAVSMEATDPNKITLDLKGLDVVEVIKLLAAKKNLNVVVGANVKGRVTMFLKGVDIMDAFEMILLSNSLAYDKMGDIVNVMTQREYEDIYGEKFVDKKETKVYHLKYAQATQVGQALNQIKTKLGKIVVDEASNTVIVIDSPLVLPQIVEIISGLDTPTTTKIFELKYATAGDLKANITDGLSKNIGTIRIDDRTNKIVVTDLETKMDRVSEMIKAFDEKSRQVLIEAKIVSVTLDDQLKLGIDWQTFLNKINNQILNKSIDIKSMFEIAVKNTLNPGLQVMLGPLDAGSDYAVMIQALKTVGDVNVLSSPRITAINNQEAKIMVGKSQPYATNTMTVSTGGTTNGTNLTFMDIGVKLYVTPTINKDGYISMRIKPEVSTAGTPYIYGTPPTSVPVVETTQAETSVMVKDGTTIIIGGLITDTRTKTVSKVPFFGSLPYVGLLFSKTDDRVQKQELVVFLTPHIISGGEDIIESPMSPPIGYKGFFTSSEKMAFEKRPEIPMDPAMFTKGAQERVMKENREKIKKLRDADITCAPVLSGRDQAAAIEEYNYVVKARIADKIASAKKRSSLKGTAKVSFAVSRDGKIAGEPSVIESTDHAVGSAVVKFVKGAAPFPVFPGNMDPGDKRFVIVISLE